MNPMRYSFTQTRTARPPKAFENFAKGSEIPFIAYINFKDLFGAEQLCRSYLQQQGFEKIVIEKRKLIEEQFLQNQKLIDADPPLKEALKTGDRA